MSGTAGYDPQETLTLVKGGFTLCEKSIEIGAKAAREGLYITFQLAAVAVAKALRAQAAARRAS